MAPSPISASTPTVWRTAQFAADDAVGELRVRPEVGAVADDGLALQDRARVDRDVAPELDRDVDERLARIEHRHAVEQPVTVRAVAELALGERELPAVVDALRLARRGLHGADAVAHRRQTLDHVGEVELGLRVVGRQVAQRRSEQVAPEGVDAHVRFLDVELVGRRVALLDDAHHPPVAGADDPPVAGRVVEHAREQRRRVAVGDVGRHELVERLGREQRRVARHDDDDRIVVVVVTAERRHADRRGVAGAALLGLLGEGDVGPRRRGLLDVLGDLLGAVADDDDRARRVQPLQGVDDVQHHRPAADAVQRLRSLRPHARPGACRQQDR